MAKWVRLTYFLVFPHDCRSTVGFGGHQGDPEQVRLELYSYDLKTWYLYQAFYAHHDQNHWFSGTYLEDRARSLGVNIGSVNAYCGEPNLLPYSISKGGLMTLTRNVADALGTEQVRVNQMNIGWTLTPNETYAVTAFILALNKIVPEDAVMDAKTLPGVKMPARDRFVIDNRKGGKVVK